MKAAGLWPAAFSLLPKSLLHMTAARMTDRELQVRVNTHLTQKNWKEAVEGLSLLLERQPRNAGLLIQRSYAESHLGSYRAARQSAIDAARYRPATSEVARDVLARLRTFNEYAETRSYLDRLGTPDRLPIPLLLAVAAQFSYWNDQETALKWLDEAKRADPDYPGTMLSRAQVLLYLGRWEQAEDELQRCLRRAPELPELYRLFANLRKATPAENHVNRIRQLLARPGMKPMDTVRLAYALHKQLDDLGEAEDAWSAVDLACQTMRGILRYDCAETKKLVDDLLVMPVSREARTITSQAGATPIFIVGMHRSGTTLLEQLINGNPSVHGVGEIYDFTSAMRYATDHHCKGVIDSAIVQRAEMIDFAEVGRRYLDGVQWRLSAESFFTDKLPSNFLNIGFICQALPRAKILHLVRDPVETCFSNLRELFSEANPYTYDQSELADYFHQYRRLMAHWHAAFPGRILDVGYADLTRDPAASMRKVAAFCGLDYIEAMSDPRNSTRAVATASATQVRNVVTRREFPKWVAYERYLQPMIMALNQVP